MEDLTRTQFIQILPEELEEASQRKMCCLLYMLL